MSLKSPSTLPKVTHSVTSFTPSNCVHANFTKQKAVPRVVQQRAYKTVPIWLRGDSGSHAQTGEARHVNMGIQRSIFGYFTMVRRVKKVIWSWALQCFVIFSNSDFSTSNKALIFYVVHQREGQTLNQKPK